MGTTPVTVASGQNTVTVSVSGSSYTRLLDSASAEVGRAAGLEPSLSYTVEWTALAPATYTVEADGTISSVVASNTPALAPADQRYTPEGYPKMALAAPSDTEGVPIIAVAPYSAARQYYERGNGDAPYSANPGATNIFDMLIAADMVGSDGACQFFGGEYWTDSNVQRGDYAEFSIVDKDDVLGYHTALGIPLGTPIELAKYITRRPLRPDFYGRIAPGQATKLVQGLYLRASYVATATGVARTFLVNYWLAR